VHLRRGRWARNCVRTLSDFGHLAGVLDAEVLDQRLLLFYEESIGWVGGEREDPSSVPPVAEECPQREEVRFAYAPG